MFKGQLQFYVSDRSIEVFLVFGFGRWWFFVRNLRQYN